jgi:hypothetical protein
MKRLKKALMTLVPSLLLMGFGSAAFAASPVGQWTVAFYLEPGLTTGASQGICFVAGGTWFSTTFSGWNGDWFQKGDRFRWYGDTSSLGTAEFGQFVNNTQIGGEFAHFLKTGTPPVTSSRGNWRATRVGSTCGSPASSQTAPAAPDADPADR